MLVEGADESINKHIFKCGISAAYKCQVGLSKSVTV